MTKGSIHYHFKNRAGLLAAVAIWLFLKIEAEVALATPDPTAEAYVRALFQAQTLPMGRTLFMIGDELARDGELGEIDPYRYFCEKFETLQVSGSPQVVAAAVTQLGRQLAYGLAPASEIEDMIRALRRGGALS